MSLALDGISLFGRVSTASFLDAARRRVGLGYQAARLVPVRVVAERPSNAITMTMAGTRGKQGVR